jgi:hypothetical protein
MVEVTDSGKHYRLELCRINNGRESSKTETSSQCYTISAFMGMTSKTTDLRLLKKLVFNSIKYSSLSEARSSHLKTTLFFFCTVGEVK